MALTLINIVNGLEALYTTLCRSAAANSKVTVTDTATLRKMLDALEQKVVSTSNVPLVNVVGDFESLLLQLKSRLTSQAWLDFQTSSAGTTLLEHMSLIGVYNQFNIELALREAFPTTALRDSSIYATSRMLGVQIPRKMPAAITANITYSADPNIDSTPITIPPNSTFSVGDGTLFNNKSTLVINPGTTIKANLYAGEPRTATFTAQTVPYYEYVINEPGFVVSSAPGDFRVYSLNFNANEYTEWTSTDQPLWNHGPSDPVYYESTTGNGSVALLFGDGTYGKQPTPGDTITVSYIVVTGNEVRDLAPGTPINYQNSTAVTGNVVSVVAAGVSEKSALYYKVYAPHIFKARGRAVNKTDYMAIILSHPDVASCVVQGQRDLYPNDPKWMNVVRVCVLPSDPALDNWGTLGPPLSAQWQAFVDWLTPKAAEPIQIWPYNPTPMNVTVSLRVAIKQFAVADSVRLQITQNMNALFARGIYSLGKRIYLYDIQEACAIDGVDYVQIVSPTTDIEPTDAYTYVVMESLDVVVFYSERKSLPLYR